MIRILPVTLANAPAPALPSLQAVRQKLGFLPNMMATMGHAPAALKGYLALDEALRGGGLSARERELVALAVAEANACGYCVAVHSYYGQRLGLTVQEMSAAQRADSLHARERALLVLAGEVMRQHGVIADATLQQARAAGIGDALVVEVVALVALNFLTNCLNHVARTELDFPPAS